MGKHKLVCKITLLLLAYATSTILVSDIVVTRPGLHFQEVRVTTKGRPAGKRPPQKKPAPAKTSPKVLPKPSRPPAPTPTPTPIARPPVKSPVTRPPAPCSCAREQQQIANLKKTTQALTTQLQSVRAQLGASQTVQKQQKDFIEQLKTYLERAKEAAKIPAVIPPSTIPPAVIPPSTLPISEGDGADCSAQEAQVQTLSDKYTQAVDYARQIEGRYRQAEQALVRLREQQETALVSYNELKDTLTGYWHNEQKVDGLYQAYRDVLASPVDYSQEYTNTLYGQLKQAWESYNDSSDALNQALINSGMSDMQIQPNPLFSTTVEGILGLHEAGQSTEVTSSDQTE